MLCLISVVQNQFSVLIKILELHLFKGLTTHLITSCLQKLSQVTCGEWSVWKLQLQKCNRGDFCVFCKDSNWLDDYLALLRGEELLTLWWRLPPLKGVWRTTQSVSLTFLPQPVAMGRGEDGRGLAGSGNEQLCWLTATISFVTGAEEQGQWLLQFVVLVNCWIGTGPLLWWDQAGEGSYMWNRPSSQKRGNGLLYVHGWSLCLCVCVSWNTATTMSAVMGTALCIAEHKQTQIQTHTDRNQPTET